MSNFGVNRSGASSGTGVPTGAISEALIDAKGDLIVGSADNTAAKLTAGANNTRLVADSAQTKGLKYVADTVNYVVTTLGDLLVATANQTITRLGVGTDGYRLQAQSGDATGVQYLPPDLGFSLINGYLDWTVSGNALTCAIKTWAGADPSTTNPVYALIRSSTATTGLPNLVKITAANSVTVASGSTLGTRNALASRVWAVLFDDAGTYRLGVINCLTTVAGAGAGSDVTAVYQLAGWGIASSTLVGGASNSAQTFYTAGAGVTSKPFATLGYVTFESGQAAAGTWATAASRKQLWGPGVPLPGNIVQVQRNDTGAVATGTTLIPNDDTIPQSTEGDQYLSQAITPSSAANVLAIKAQLQLANSNAGPWDMAAALFQDATANALKVANALGVAANYVQLLVLDGRLLTATTSATTLKIRAGGSGAGTTTFNGSAAARRYGGVMNSFLEVAELMA